MSKRRGRERAKAGQDPKAAPEAERSSRARGKRGSRKGKEREPATLLDWVKSLAVAGIVYLLLRSFVLQTFVITSGSMENTLLVGDMLVVDRAAIGGRVPFTNIRLPGYSQPRRGDVIVFDPAHEDTLTLVKRLVGLPGDTLHMTAGVLHLNGAPYPEPYARHLPAEDGTAPEMYWQRRYLAPGVDSASYHPTRDNWGPLVIPADRYFMLGDNREESLDSRYWGLLEGWRLEGRASFTYYSYNKGSFSPFPWLREVRWDRLFRDID